MKPLLASEISDLRKLKYPIMCSPKLDGIRALVCDGKLVSRTLKKIPNQHIYKTLSIASLNGLDGEIVSGETFSETTSNVMSVDGKPDFIYHVFDRFIDYALPFSDRYAALNDAVNKIQHPNIAVVPHVMCGCENDVLKYYRESVDAGFEGIMLRAPSGVYKHGRSTEKEGILLKMKPFNDIEVVVVGFEPLRHNRNEAVTNELGNMKRSSHKKNLEEAETLGSLVVFDKTFGEFSVGTGFTSAQRKEIWDNRDQYLGKTVRVKYQEKGTKVKPRIPVFEGFRDLIDIGEPE